MGRHQGYVEREREHFDRLAEAIGETGTHRKTIAGLKRMRRRGALLADDLRGLDSPRVLELGAGAGAFTQFILEALPGLCLVGCDISPKCVEIAASRFGEEHPNASFEVADCTRLKWADEEFDCVCGCSILHHLPVDASLAEAYRVLRPGGLLWFSEPNMMNPQIAIQKNVKFIGRWLEDTEDETAFFRWPLARLLHRIGFERVAVRPFDFLHPGIPGPLAGIVNAFGLVFERAPIVREAAGSLLIRAGKPAC